MLEESPLMSIEIFETEFLTIRDALTSYLFRLTASRQDAEDLVQDTYIKARRNVPGFKGKSSIKTWIFSIATNLARDHHRAQKRWQEDTQDRCRERKYNRYRQR